MAGSKETRQAPSAPPAQAHRLGELVQIDGSGSPHDWFEGRGPRCTLIAFIDDATSRVMAARFLPPPKPHKPTWMACMPMFWPYGCPAVLYSDRHGIFTKHDPKDVEPTQFQRATAELSIATIQALTPQSKDGLERLVSDLAGQAGKGHVAGLD